ncbi:hypothetical protein M408DRAFT_327148 [Serendipita vermifera MAFF 305830]|uniref:NADH-ubiquinone oxidoreductase 9.5 kDa subunit n=1 Tax=Serendipita vermifera MAFF 305830 TaxID=933852 RepID=A0A0C3BHV8_SERVB|nr:hypothetical protein M408DRAFT_327148 [Serendipita vermifera MAFF 305830]
MAFIYRALQRHAHESPVYFYSILIGAAGPVALAVVPPIRRRFGYEPPEYIPTSYPTPKRERVTVSSEFDDPPQQKSQEQLELETKARIPEFKIR